MNTKKKIKKINVKVKVKPRPDLANSETENVDLAEWCRRSDNLTRKMRHWAMEHNTEKIIWNLTPFQEKYCLYYDSESHTVETDFVLGCIINSNVYFDTYETAVLAIAEFGNEFKWLAENRPEWF